MGIKTALKKLWEFDKKVFTEVYKKDGIASKIAGSIIGAYLNPTGMKLGQNLGGGVTGDVTLNPDGQNADKSLLSQIVNTIGGISPNKLPAGSPQTTTSKPIDTAKIMRFAGAAIAVGGIIWALKKFVFKKGRKR